MAEVEGVVVQAVWISIQSLMIPEVLDNDTPSWRATNSIDTSLPPLVSISYFEYDLVYRSKLLAEIIIALIQDGQLQYQQLVTFVHKLADNW